MQRVEFNTIIDKPYIEVPNYEELKGHKVSITFLDLDNNKQKQEDYIQYLINNPANIDKNIKFLSRDEANAR
jgi:hypothetical protein